ncbi:hypothetical protein MAE02_23350 [Microvirga aerophila]|uniref:Uncharacterized protein n=1 Tax=Microvirga aerophila TaxID=670291 RepID=A0A512BRL2_9HYPH|nr:hypothetical protein MAE02_23350 [Microvirga aerophila]
MRKLGSVDIVAVTFLRCLPDDVSGILVTRGLGLAVAACVLPRARSGASPC